MNGFKAVKHFEDSDITMVFDQLEAQLKAAFYKEESATFMTLADEKIVKKLFTLELIEEETPAVCSGSLGVGSMVNIIPAEKNGHGRCSSLLVVFCFSKGKLGERLREMLYHLGIYCRGVSKKVLIITSQWDNSAWETHSQAVDALKQQEGIEIFKAQLEGNIFNKSQLL
jgi:hypothetical protein